MAARKRTPSKNVYWRDIPKTARVEDRGALFVVTLPGGRHAVAYWMGNEAIEAQRTLARRARSARRRYAN